MRQVDNFIGRLREALRQQQSGHIEHALQQRLAKTWPSGIARCPYDATLGQARELQAKLRQEQRTQIIRKWRDRMRENGKALTAWLRSTRFLLPSAVASGQGRHRRVSASFPKAINMIEKFWRKVWDRPLNCEELNKSQEGRLTAPSGETFDSRACLSAEELHMQAQHDAHGTAGPDGWTASELSHLPLAYMERIFNYACTLDADQQLPAGVSTL